MELFFEVVLPALSRPITRSRKAQGLIKRNGLGNDRILYRERMRDSIGDTCETKIRVHPLVGI